MTDEDGQLLRRLVEAERALARFDPPARRLNGGTPEPRIIDQADQAEFERLTKEVEAARAAREQHRRDKSGP